MQAILCKLREVLTKKALEKELLTKIIEQQQHKGVYQQRKVEKFYRTGSSCLISNT
jgi:hypothetical protein